MGQIYLCDPRKTRIGWRPPEDWIGWNETVHTIVYATPGRPERLEVVLLRIDLFLAELLQESDLRSDETEGFRVFWGTELGLWLEFVRTQTGLLRVRCRLSPYVCMESVESPTFNPSGQVMRVFDKAIEFLLERPPK